MERAVERGQKASSDVYCSSGVDEKRWPTTSVCHFGVRPGQVHGGVIADDRKKTSLDPTTVVDPAAVGASRRCMDMWQPFMPRRSPRSSWRMEVVFDRYHIMAHMSRQSIRCAARTPAAATPRRPDLDGIEIPLALLPENVQTTMLNGSNCFDRNTCRRTSLGHQGSLRHLWSYERMPGQAVLAGMVLLGDSFAPPAVVKVAKMIKNHLSNVLTYFDHRITTPPARG